MTCQSGWLPESNSRQLSHRPQGESDLDGSQRNSLARARAVVALPIPAGPAKISPCGNRSARYARRSDSIASSWPKMALKADMSAADRSRRGGVLEVLADVRCVRIRE